MTATTPRRRREVIVRSDGREVRPASTSVRADVLWYPRTRWPSVLVRRTHDVELARRLAEERWAEVADDRPLTGGSRVGWWRTYASTAGPPADGAEDQHGRVVLWCEDTVAGAGPGVEFRP